jgi:hypothetical protein
MREKEQLRDGGINGRMDLKEIRCKDMDWFHLADGKSKW